jgi:hypothetical protein
MEEICYIVQGKATIQQIIRSKKQQIVAITSAGLNKKELLARKTAMLK